MRYFSARDSLKYLESRQCVLRVGESEVGRALVPLHRLVEVGIGEVRAGVVHDGDAVGGLGASLLGCGLQHLEGELPVLGHSLSLEVHVADGVQGLLVAGVGAGGVEPDGLGMVLEGGTLLPGGILSGVVELEERLAGDGVPLLREHALLHEIGLDVGGVPADLLQDDGGGLEASLGRFPEGRLRPCRVCVGAGAGIEEHPVEIGRLGTAVRPVPGLGECFVHVALAGAEVHPCTDASGILVDHANGIVVHRPSLD